MFRINNRYTPKHWINVLVVFTINNRYTPKDWINVLVMFTVKNRYTRKHWINVQVVFILTTEHTKTWCCSCLQLTADTEERHHRIEAYSEPKQTSKMNLFTKVVNGEEVLTIFLRKLHLRILKGFGTRL